MPGKVKHTAKIHPIKIYGPKSERYLAKLLGIFKDCKCSRCELITITLKECILKLQRVKWINNHEDKK